jgi:20S proteasome alpha/beta subunit
MTFIIGAKCKDGVVLVGDRKVSGGIKKFTDKIRPLEAFPTIVFTAAGIQSLFEEFLEEVQRLGFSHSKNIEEYNKNNPNNAVAFTVNDFKHICSETIKKMKQVYSEIENVFSFDEALQVLFVVPEVKNAQGTPIPRLYFMDMDTCYPQPIEQGKIVPIGISHLGQIFLKQFEIDSDFSMKDIARIGTFIIKYIEKENLHDGVGVGDIEPQIWFFEDNKGPKEIKDKELKELLEYVDEEVINVIKKIGSSSKFLRG